MNSGVVREPVAGHLLLSLEGLTKYFETSGGIFSRRRKIVRAVDGVDLKIYRGETLALVGESGSGKSTLARLIMRLERPSSGRLFLEGEDVLAYSGKELKRFRRNVQIIFQDPYASLNPRRNAGSIIAEAFQIHGLYDRAERREQAARLLETVGLTREQMSRYPHEFSGGQRQRIGIARAIALHPRLIIADEPVSALDVSIQAQILNLLKNLQRGFDLTYLFISHDLSVVEHMSDRVAVMYLGRIVELAGNRELYESPLHPYTEALFSAVPAFRPEEKKERILLGGDIPSPSHTPAGCPFHPRCPKKMDICVTVRPELTERVAGRRVACHLY